MPYPTTVRPELVEGRAQSEPLDRITIFCQANGMAFWAYLLRCSDGKYYAGHTDALEARVAAHMAGRGSDFTARRQPVVFVWAQDFPSRLEALQAERQIKGWSRAKKEALIAGDWERVSQLARSFGARPSTGSGRTVEGGEDSLPSPVRAEPVEACPELRRRAHAAGDAA